MVDEMDWLTLYGAYGIVKGMPLYLKALEDNEAEALYNIMGHIEHQGTLYPLTVAVVPELLKILVADNQAPKAKILENLHFLTEAMDEFVGWGLQSLRGSYTRMLFELQTALENGAPIYVNLLSHPDASVRQRASVFLPMFVTNSIARAHLWSAYEKERDPLTAAVLLLQAGFVPPSNEQAGDRKANVEPQKRFLEIATSHEIPEVRLAAALGWAYHRLSESFGRYDAPPNEIVEILYDWVLDDYQGLPKKNKIKRQLPFDTLPHFLKEHVTVDSVFRLLRTFDHKVQSYMLEDKRLTPLVAHIVCRDAIEFSFKRTNYITVTRDATPEMKDSMYWNANIPFHYRKLKYPASMTYQRETHEAYNSSDQKIDISQYFALKTVVDCEKFWSLPTNLFSFFYGLPDDREALRQLVVNNKPPHIKD